MIGIFVRVYVQFTVCLRLLAQSDRWWANKFIFARLNLIYSFTSHLVIEWTHIGNYRAHVCTKTPLDLRSTKSLFFFIIFLFNWSNCTHIAFYAPILLSIRFASSHHHRHHHFRWTSSVQPVLVGRSVATIGLSSSSHTHTHTHTHCPTINLIVKSL